MNENRKRILEMLAAGQINTEEAERLIAALEKEPATPASSKDAEAHPDVWPQYLRVVVESEDSHYGQRPSKVNIRVPMRLLRAGVKLASLIPPHARMKVNEALRQKGIDVDVNQLKPEDLEDLIYQFKDLSVDVDDHRSKVRVYCE